MARSPTTTHPAAVLGSRCACRPARQWARRRAIVRRRAESLLPALVLLGFLVAAVVVSLLLNDAERRGVSALEESVGGEVQAIAASQDQRFQNTFGATSGLSNPEEPFELTRDSQAGRAELSGLI